MTRRSRKDALETRERLLDAALAVFRERGVSRPSLTDIAAVAGVTRGAVYVHFENKGDLFSALLDRTLLPSDALAAWKPTAGTPLERLHASFEFMMHETATNPIWRQMLEIAFHRCEKLEENGAIVQRLRTGRTDAVATLSRLAQEAVDAGELPADLDVPTAVAFLHSCVIGTLSQWILHGQLDLAEKAGPFADALIDMLKLSPALRRPPQR